MLSYYIASNKQLDKQLLRDGTTLDPSKEADREAFFLRSLKRCPFVEGQCVRVHGTQQKGVIKRIIRNFKEVVWENDLAHFLVVKWNTGKSSVASPSQLTAKRAK